MAEETSASAAAPATPKKGKRTSGVKPKKTKIAPSHPKVSVMVPAAIGALKERGGSSLQAIKKYVSANYKVDADRLAPFIKKYLKGAVESGALLQTKGKGASGSFKLKGTAPKAAAAADARPAKAKKPAAVGRPKKVPAAKKSPAKSRKAPAAAEKKSRAAKKASPKKAVKKPAPKPKKAAKPKAPKPKKAKSSPKKTAKK